MKKNMGNADRIIRMIIAALVCSSLLYKCDHGHFGYCTFGSCRCVRIDQFSELFALYMHHSAYGPARQANNGLIIGRI
jgi:hypothetical protein